MVVEVVVEKGLARWAPKGKSSVLYGDCENVHSVSRIYSSDISLFPIFSFELIDLVVKRFLRRSGFRTSINSFLIRADGVSDRSCNLLKYRIRRKFSHGV